MGGFNGRRDYIRLNVFDNTFFSLTKESCVQVNAGIRRDNLVAVHFSCAVGHTRVPDSNESLYSHS